MIESRILNKKQNGAILMIAMIMIAIMTSIGTSTLAKVMAEAKSVRAGRKLITQNSSHSFKKLNEIVRNKQQVFGFVDAPYMKPKVLEFVSVGHTRMTLNGLPIIHEPANMTTITCPSNVRQSFPIYGSVCSKHYASDFLDDLDNYNSRYDNYVVVEDSGVIETDSVTGDISVHTQAFNWLVSKGIVSAAGEDFIVQSEDTIVDITIVYNDPNNYRYYYVYDRSLVYLNAGTVYTNGILWHLRKFLIGYKTSQGSDYINHNDLYFSSLIQNYKEFRIKIYRHSDFDKDNVFCASKDFSYESNVVGQSCPSKCYQNVDEPTCAETVDIACKNIADTYYTNVFNNVEPSGGWLAQSIGQATEKSNVCISWGTAIKDCEVSNANYADPYVLPNAKRYNFANIESLNMFTVHNNVDGMKVPSSADKRDSCTDFPAYDDVAVGVYMGAIYDKDAPDTEKEVIGADNINSPWSSLNMAPDSYWINFLASDHNLLKDNSEVRDFDPNSGKDSPGEVLHSLKNINRGLKHAPWIMFRKGFNTIKIGWITSAPDQIVLTQFYNGNLSLLAERKTSDPNCTDGSCTFEWKCNESEIKSFDYWYTKVPSIALGSYSKTAPVGYYISGIGNIECLAGEVSGDLTIYPSPVNRKNLSEDKKATWERDGDIPLTEIGPRLSGIAGRQGCILDVVSFIPYDGATPEKCTKISGNGIKIDQDYCVNAQAAQGTGGGRFSQHHSQYYAPNSISAGVYCPKGAYIKEFKWMPKTSPWTSANYSDVSLIKDVRCSDGTTLQTPKSIGGVSYGKGMLGNLDVCRSGITSCASTGTAAGFKIWCDGEPMPPFDSTAKCLGRGFGAESVSTINSGNTVRRVTDRGTFCY